MVKDIKVDVIKSVSPYITENQNRDRFVKLEHIPSGITVTKYHKSLMNTKNGQMWQVQWDTKNNQFQTPISLTTLVTKEEEKIGRFFIYPTTNIYNFILLDQIDGRVWQVQWSTEAKERMVLRIY